MLSQGDIAAHDTRMIGLAVLKGFFAPVSDVPVSFVNAPNIAKSAGLALREVARADTDEYVNLITISDGQRSIAGTLSGRRAEPRLVAIDCHGVDMPPSAHMVVISNDDRPGVIGLVGTTMGAHGVNIADMDVGRTPDAGSAVMVLATDGEPPAAALDEIRRAPGITSVSYLRG